VKHPLEEGGEELHTEEAIKEEEGEEEMNKFKKLQTLLIATKLKEMHLMRSREASRERLIRRKGTNQTSLRRGSKSRMNSKLVSLIIGNSKSFLEQI
jgi:hypothetical protein